MRWRECRCTAAQAFAVRKLTIKATLAELGESKLQASVRLDIISRR